MLTLPIPHNRLLYWLPSDCYQASANKIAWARTLYPSCRLSSTMRRAAPSSSPPMCRCSCTRKYKHLSIYLSATRSSSLLCYDQSISLRRFLYITNPWFVRSRYAFSLVSSILLLPVLTTIPKKKMPAIVLMVGQGFRYPENVFQSHIVLLYYLQFYEQLTW